LADELSDETADKDDAGVMSKRDTADETAELAGVPKFLEARRTFQNWLIS